MLIRPTEAAGLVARFDPGHDGRSLKAKLETLALLRDTSQPCRRDTYVPGHLTASGLVLSPNGAAVLLVHHARLGRWLQPGGHLEPDDRDLPGAARREVLEETSVGLRELNVPLVGVDVHSIPATRGEPPHQHFDLVFGFVAASWQVASPERLRATWCELRQFEAYGVDQATRAATDRARQTFLAEGAIPGA